jgi:hypothetical protein
MGNLLSRRPIAECSGEGKSPILRREVLLPVNQFAALLARNALDDAIPPPPLNGRSDDPRLAVTELVSNAVRHAGLETDAELIHLRIEADDDHVASRSSNPLRQATCTSPSSRAPTSVLVASASDWLRCSRTRGASNRGRLGGCGSSSGRRRSPGSRLEGRSDIYG